MSTIGPQLPLMGDNIFGAYSSITQYRDEIQQNLKNLLLTSPGERMMNPDFGVGLRHFLFEPRQHNINAIRQRVENQVRKYMPFIRSLKVQFDTGAEEEYLDNSNILSIRIIYDIPDLNLSTSLLLQKEDIS
jgi:phage baseplate assembly protein W|tara:strand:+ start:234 stop:629 length:396 start_codon:yes stop_codon:yes gene_type:complete